MIAKERTSHSQGEGHSKESNRPRFFPRQRCFVLWRSRYRLDRLFLLFFFFSPFLFLSSSFRSRRGHAFQPFPRFLSRRVEPPFLLQFVAFFGRRGLLPLLFLALKAVLTTLEVLEVRVPLPRRGRRGSRSGGGVVEPRGTHDEVKIVCDFMIKMMLFYYTSPPSLGCKSAVVGDCLAIDPYGLHPYRGTRVVFLISVVLIKCKCVCVCVSLCISLFSFSFSLSSFSLSARFSLSLTRTA